MVFLVLIGGFLFPRRCQEVAGAHCIGIFLASGFSVVIGGDRCFVGVLVAGNLAM